MLQKIDSPSALAGPRIDGESFDGEQIAAANRHP
jgi:hypothetical protein